MKKIFKNNLFAIIVFIALTCLFIYSTIHVCTYLFGTEREIYVKYDDNCSIVDRYACDHYVWYNNGKKMVTEQVHLSFVETAQWKKNSGYIKFKQLGTHLSHRSAFIYSTIYDIVFISFSTWFVISVIDKKKNKKTK